jgi:hypothetical protein
LMPISPASCDTTSGGEVMEVSRHLLTLVLVCD